MSQECWTQLLSGKLINTAHSSYASLERKSELGSGVSASLDIPKLQALHLLHATTSAMKNTLPKHAHRKSERITGTAVMPTVTNQYMLTGNHTKS